MWTVLKFVCWFRFRFCFVFKFSSIFCIYLCQFKSVYSRVACFCCVGFSFFSTKAADWLGRMSPKCVCVEWNIKLTQSINQSMPFGLQQRSMRRLRLTVKPSQWLGPWVHLWAAIIHIHHRHLLLLIPKADIYFTIPQTLKDWVDIGDTVRVGRPCPCCIL